MVMDMAMVTVPRKRTSRINKGNYILRFGIGLNMLII